MALRKAAAVCSAIEGWHEQSIRWRAGHAERSPAEEHRFQPLHAWAISQRLKQISADVLQVRDGSLYPPLLISIGPGVSLCGALIVLRNAFPATMTAVMS